MIVEKYYILGKYSRKTEILNLVLIVVNFWIVLLVYLIISGIDRSLNFKAVLDKSVKKEDYSNEYKKVMI